MRPPGTATAWNHWRRISRRLANCQGSRSLSLSALLSRSAISGMVIRSWQVRPSTAICSVRTLAPPDGIITAMSQWSTPAAARRLTTHLEQALALAEEDDEIYSDSSLYRPSITAHDQNRHRESGGMGHLIDLVRDAYLEVAAIDRPRAEHLLRRWVLSREPLFTRLALHALTEDPKSDINLARALLLTRRPRGVWNWELQREVLRLLRKAGARLPRHLPSTFSSHGTSTETRNPSRPLTHAAILS